MLALAVITLDLVVVPVIERPVSNVFLIWDIILTLQLWLAPLALLFPTVFNAVVSLLVLNALLAIF